MKNTDITKIRQALKNALRLISGERIKYDAFPALEELEKTLEAYIRASEEELEQALTLLPCETCGGTGKKPEADSWSDGLTIGREGKSCPDCKGGKL